MKESFALLSASSARFLFCFIRLFWNQVLTCKMNAIKEHLASNGLLDFRIPATYRPLFSFAGNLCIIRNLCQNLSKLSDKNKLRFIERDVRSQFS